MTMTTLARVTSLQPPSDEQWRRYGEKRRNQLLQEDQSSGGMSFSINKECQVQKYFALAERVIAQFQMLCENLDVHLEAAYVMGHRLVSFLDTALPQHPEYQLLSLTAKRLQCQKDLKWIQRRLTDIALLIDEEQLNLYVDCDFEPAAEDSVSTEQEEEAWESFTGWTDTDFLGSPAPLVDTDVSSCCDKEASLGSSESDAENDETQQPQTMPQQFHFDIDESEEPIYYAALQEEQEEEEPCRYTLNEPVVASSFLKKIANEDVRYETDSEAVDSWAQDNDSAALSGSSAGSALTCDPARIALKELMDKLNLSRGNLDSSAENVAHFGDALSGEL